MQMIFNIAETGCAILINVSGSGKDVYTIAVGYPSYRPGRREAASHQSPGCGEVGDPSCKNVARNFRHSQEMP
jgi:hypothetical protein